MADNTTPDTTDAGAQAPDIRGTLLAYLTKMAPDAPDATKVQIVNTVKDEYAKAGKDVNTEPLQSVIGVINTAMQNVAKTAPAPSQGTLATQTVQDTAPTPQPSLGSAADVNKSIASMPTLGTPPTQTGAPQDVLAQGTGYMANRMNTADPAAYQQALMDQYKALGGGGAGDIVRGLGAIASGFSGNQAAAGNLLAQQEKLAAMPAAAIKGAGELAQTQMTGANAALGSATAGNAAIAKLDMDKRAFVTDQMTKGLALEQATTAWDQVGKNLYDPKSTSSTISQQLAEQAMGLKAGTLAGHSAAQISQEVAGMKPATELQKQYYDQFIAKENADSARMTAASGAAATNLGTKLVSGATQGGTVLPQGMNLSVGAGPASLSPSPATTGAQTGGAEMINKTRNQVQAYTTSGVGTAIDTALSTLGSAKLLDTGIVGTQLAKLSPTTASALKANLSTYYQTQGLTPEASDAQAATIFAMTPARATQRLAQIKAANQAATKSLPAMEQHQAKTGSLLGFTPQSEQQFYSPRTGQVISGHQDEARAAGYIPLTGVQ